MFDRDIRVKPWEVGLCVNTFGWLRVASGGCGCGSNVFLRPHFDESPLLNQLIALIHVLLITIVNSLFLFRAPMCCCQCQKKLSTPGYSAVADLQLYPIEVRRQEADLFGQQLL